MTPAQRVSAVQVFGFTERQARFLVTAMLNGGVCVVRQYCAFVDIERGQVTHDFFGGLVARKFASRYLDAHRRFVIFHLHHKALYAAIGEPDSRFRKPTPLPTAVERLMVLDAVLQRPDVHWLATEREKVAHFTKTLGTAFRREDLPRLVFGQPPCTTTRYFFDKLPIGVADEGAVHLFPYLVTRESPLDFRAFLHRHAELLRALRSWRLWLLVPSHLAKAADTFRDVAHEELASPLRPAVADELLWFFRASDAPPPPRSAESSRFAQARHAFSAPRYRRLYRTWRQMGRSCVDATVSRTLADAVERGLGQVNVHVLPHAYRHLSPLVGTA